MIIDRKPSHLPIDSNHCFLFFVELHEFSEWLHSQLLHANTTVVDFLISASLTMTLSQAWFYMKEETKTGRKATLIK